MKTKMTLISLLAFTCTLILSGCGVKPDKLASPNPDDQAPFPSTYPRSAE